MSDKVRMCKACEIKGEGTGVKMLPDITFLTGVLWARGGGSKQTFQEFYAECCPAHQSYLDHIRQPITAN